MPNDQPAPARDAPPPPIPANPDRPRWQNTVETVRDLAHLLHRGQVVPAGQPGGPPWPLDRQADLWGCLEHGWPVRPLLAWSPTGLFTGRWHVLDGHRLLAAVAALLPASPQHLVRDLATASPSWVPRDARRPGGCYLPTDACLLTMRFLAVVHEFPPEVRQRAESIADRIGKARIPVLVIACEDPSTVAAISARLAPGRVPTDLPARIAATG